MIWVGRLISFAILLQTIEFFWVPFYSPTLTAVEFPKLLRWILKCDRWVLAIRLIGALVALLLPSVASVTILLASTWWLAVRWRGTFNGGSDIMTFHILAAWLVSLVFPTTERACLYYIAAQLILSYFVAGRGKVAHREWRDGSALQLFLRRWGWSISARTSFALSWTLMLFELLFPLALFMPWPFVVLGILFHLANAYVFGLNRFFWVWLAAYPALLFASLPI